MRRIPVIYNTLVLLVLCGNIILAFSLIYIFFDFINIGKIVEHHTGPYHGLKWLDNNIMRAIYFSAITLLSVGYGDVTPFGWSRGIAMIEALIGYILPAVIAVQYLRLFPTTIETMFRFLNRNINKNNKNK